MVHNNEEISSIEKFNYLFSYLEGDAARSIQGLALTNANYSVAVDLLKERFGQPQLIIAAHMDELLKLPSLSSNCRVREIRSTLDRLNIHVRGLDTLGVSAQQYGSLLTPVVMSKLPPDIRLIITRRKPGEVLDLSEIIDMLKAEVEAREASASLKPNEHSHESKRQWDRPQSSGVKNIATGAFLNNSTTQSGNITCVYCLKQHYSASCTEVIDIGKRREILMRDHRCFLCLRKGHRAANCDRTTNCRKCNKHHHQSICSAGRVQQDQLPSSTRLTAPSNSNPAPNIVTENDGTPTGTLASTNLTVPPNPR